MNRLPIFFLLLSLFSCQKVIDLKLNNAGKQYVVEGNITDQPGPYKVTIAQTENFTDSTSFQGVGGALVFIQDNLGDSETLQEIQPGVFQSTHLTGQQGVTYSLRITLDSNVFTASSTMPQKVPFDSLKVLEEPNLTKTVLAAVPYFTDPKGQGNYYRCNQYINGNLDKTIY